MILFHALLSNNHLDTLNQRINLQCVPCTIVHPLFILGYLVVDFMLAAQVVTCYQEW